MSLSAATEAIVDLVSDRAGGADARGRLDDDVVRAVLEAGFARHFVPAKWSGADGTFADAVGAVSLLGEHCPSTAWVASLAVTLSRIAGYLPLEGQRRLWQDRPDVLVVGSLLPLGTATAVDDGWLVEGSWPYISSVEFSDWALVLATPTTGGDGPRFFAVPRSAYDIEPTWSSVGMRATGSHTLVLKSVVVPPELSFARRDVDEGRAVDSAAWYHTLPLEAVAGLAFAPPILGAARGALRSWTAATARRVARAAVTGSVSPMQATYELALARSAAEIDAAELLVQRVASTVDGGDVSALDTAVSARDCALAADLLTAATDRLLGTAGTAAFAEDQALQRFWRDVHVGASHIMLQLSRAASGYAKAVLPEPAR